MADHSTVKKIISHVRQYPTKAPLYFLLLNYFLPVLWSYHKDEIQNLDS